MAPINMEWFICQIRIWFSLLAVIWNFNCSLHVPNRAMDSDSTNEIVVALAAWSLPCVRSRHPCQTHRVREKCEKTLYFFVKISLHLWCRWFHCSWRNPQHFQPFGKINPSSFSSHQKVITNILYYTRGEMLSHKGSQRSRAFLTLSTLWLDPLHSKITEVPGKGISILGLKTFLTYIKINILVSWVFDLTHSHI